VGLPWQEYRSYKKKFSLQGCFAGQKLKNWVVMRAMKEKWKKYYKNLDCYSAGYYGLILSISGAEKEAKYNKSIDMKWGIVDVCPTLLMQGGTSVSGL
jgi:hypothetical protein